MTERPELCIWPHPNLRVKAKEIEDVKSEEVVKLIDDLKFLCKAYNAQGLAATQIGSDLRALVVKQEEGYLILLNPELTEQSAATVKAREGCLSFPGVHERIERHVTLTVKALDETGEPLELDLAGLDAVAIQHELDHLDGVVMLDHMGNMQKRMALKRLKKTKKLLDRTDPIQQFTLRKQKLQDQKAKRERLRKNRK